MATSKIQAGMDLLWENPNPTAALGATTLNIDTSKYRFFKVVFNWYAGGSLNEIVTLNIENGRRNLAATARDVPGYRFIDLQTSGQIVIGEGKQLYGGSEQTQNARMVPIEIYGIK